MQFESLLLLGQTHLQQSDAVSAKAPLKRACLAQAISAAAHFFYGVACRQTADHAEALRAFQQACTLSPEHAPSHYNLGNTCRDLGDFPAALAAYSQATTLDPGFAEAHCNRGTTLTELGHLPDAIESLSRAVELSPDYALALFWRARARLRTGDLHASLQDYDKALLLNKRNAEAYNGRGIVLAQLGRQEESLQSFEQASLIDPVYASPHWNEALGRLRMGELSRRSWGKLEWGWALGERQPIRQFTTPLWRGEPIAGKTIFLYDEQGLGDTLQFARLASSVAALGAQVYLQVQPALQDIMRSLSGPIQIVSSEEVPKADYHCPLLSLPFALDLTLENIPAPPAYLQPDPERVAYWAQRMGTQTKPRIGIVWTGNPEQGDNTRRSIPLEQLSGLISEHPAYQFVSLQKEPSATDREQLTKLHDCLNLGESVQDFSDTAAIVANLDLVISVCTSVAHLSAALGKPTWILLSSYPCWRWLQDRPDSPWYPSARLFRQKQAGNWQQVLENVWTELGHTLPTRAR